RRRPPRARSPTQPRRPSATEARVGSCQSEAGAADRLDQRRVAQLSSQVRHVAVDDVQARRSRTSPDLLQRELPTHDPAAVEQEELEQIGLSATETEIAA